MKNKIFWKDYPELTKRYRTDEEDELSADICILLRKIGHYIDSFNDINRQEFSNDLQGGVHLLQNILIIMQKRRYNEKQHL